MMPNIAVTPMTRELCRAYYRGFVSDPDVYMDMSAFRPFVYSDARADAYFDRQAEKQRLYFIVTEDGAPVGEVILKDLDPKNAACTLSIHLQNDRIKGRGVGTRAEQLALQHAFLTLHMDVVYADTVLKNTRSAHVLEKVGFRFLREDGMFRYYEMRKEDWFRRYPTR